MGQLFYILQVTSDTTSNYAWVNGVDWTAIAVIIAAVPIIGMLCRMLIKFGVFKEQFKTLSNSISDINKNINKNTITLRSVTTFLYSETGAQQGIFESNSPIALTELGRDLLVECGGEEFIESNLDSLIKEIEDEKLNNALDIQNFTSSLLFQKTEEVGFIKIKNFIFNKPTYKDLNVTLSMVINVMAIHLRDNYFNKHPQYLED